MWKIKIKLDVEKGKLKKKPFYVLPAMKAWKLLKGSSLQFSLDIITPL